MNARCEIPRCRGGVGVVYLGHGICTKHWDELSSETAPPGALRMALGIPEVPSTTEDSTMDDGSKKAAKAENATEATPAKAKKSARTKKDRSAKEAKPQREKVENPVVFAFRLSEADRTKIHDAAGGGKASGFVLAAALAAASGDLEAFKTVVASRATK